MDKIDNKKIWIWLPPNQGWGKRCVLALTQLHPWLGGGGLLHHFILSKIVGTKFLTWYWFFTCRQIKLIFTRTVLHLNLFWTWEFLELSLLYRPSQQVNKKTILSTGLIILFCKGEQSLLTFLFISPNNFAAANNTMIPVPSFSTPGVKSWKNELESSYIR